MKIVNGIWQVSIFILFYIVGNFISKQFHLSIPGSLIGLLLLFLLLQMNVIKMRWVEQGANWLLAELLLFFIPSAIGVIQYKQLLVSQGLQLFFIIILSTAIVMICTGLFSEYLSKHRRKL